MPTTPPKITTKLLIAAALTLTTAATALIDPKPPTKPIKRNNKDSTGKPELAGHVIRFPLNLRSILAPNQDPDIYADRMFLQSSIQIDSLNDNQTAMVFDPNYRNILIPIAYPETGRKSGIQCDKDAHPAGSTTSCLFYSNLPIQKTLGVDHWSMYNATPQGFQGENSWGWTEHTINTTKKFKTGVLTTPSKDWALGEAGIFGLGAKTATNSLWSYLFEMYNPQYGNFYATFYLDSPRDSGLYWYEVFNPQLNSSTFDYLFKGSELRVSDSDFSILDDQVQADYAVYIPSLKPGNKSQTWGLENVTVYSSDKKEPIFKNINICFAMNANTTFLMNSTKLAEFKKDALDAVCRGAKCGPGSFLLNGADITLKFQNANDSEAEFSITPGAYLYNNPKNYVQVSAGLLEDYEGEGCDSALGNQLGLGRMFFFHYQVVFKMTESGEAQIGLFPYKTRPAFAHYAKVDTLVVTGLVFVLFLFVCIMGLRWKGISEAGDDDVDEGSVEDGLSNGGYKLAQAKAFEESEDEKEADEE